MTYDENFIKAVIKRLKDELQYDYEQSIEPAKALITPLRYRIAKLIDDLEMILKQEKDQTHQKFVELNTIEHNE